jgi:hypothetical protein
MKVFLRNTQTGWFYQELSGWTPEQEAAEDLAQVARAVEIIFAAHLENVEILLCYDDRGTISCSPSPHHSSDHMRLKGQADERAVRGAFTTADRTSPTGWLRP